LSSDAKDVVKSNGNENSLESGKEKKLDARKLFLQVG